jgi:hypothetical protein
MKRGKDALFAWCKANCAGYRDVEINDFHKSWRSGLGIVHNSVRAIPDCFSSFIVSSTFLDITIEFHTKHKRLVHIQKL